MRAKPSRKISWSSAITSRIVLFIPKYSLNRNLNKIIRAEPGGGLQGKDAVEDLAPAFKAAEPQSLRSGHRLLFVESLPIILGQAEQMTIFFTETNLQVVGLRMFDGVMHNLLDHPEDVDLLFFGDPDLLDDIQLDIDRLFAFYLLDELPDGFDETLSFKGIGQKVMGNAAH